jgi:hypothetical protein
VADPATKRTNATPRASSASRMTTVDAQFDQVLFLDPADSVYVFGRASMRRLGRPLAVSIVCAIHRANGEFTHLYRVPANAAGGRREVELVGVWPGVRLAEASTAASALLSATGPADTTAAGSPALDAAA